MYCLSVSRDVFGPVTDDSYIRAVVKIAMPCALSWKEMCDAALTCEKFKTINSAFPTVNWQQFSFALKPVRNELSSCEGVILCGDRIFVPASL